MFVCKNLFINDKIIVKLIFLSEKTCLMFFAFWGSIVIYSGLYLVLSVEEAHRRRFFVDYANPMGRNVFPKFGST